MGMGSIDQLDNLLPLYYLGIKQKCPPVNHRKAQFSTEKLLPFESTGHTQHKTSKSGPLPCVTSKGEWLRSSLGSPFSCVGRLAAASCPETNALKNPPVR